MWRAAISSTIAAQGRLMKKMVRQPIVSVSQPPRTGASAPAIAVAPAQVPIALPRSASSKVAPITARLVGIIMAPPAPCRTRAASSSGRPPASPHHADPSANTMTPDMKTRRRPKRSPAAPPIRLSAR
jgi:hypothetical protein